MAKKKQAGEVIQRAYLQQKLNRDLRGMTTSSTYDVGGSAYIGRLKLWLKGETTRTKRPGGIGR